MKNDTTPFPIVELRYDDCGFVYFGKTRMGFSPISSTRIGGEKFKNSNVLLLWAAAHWELPTGDEIQAIISELKKAFPDREIFRTLTTLRQSPCAQSYLSCLLILCAVRRRWQRLRPARRLLSRSTLPKHTLIGLNSLLSDGATNSHDEMKEKAALRRLNYDE